MLGTNQLDFMSYATAFKSNYRKGVRKLEAILSNPTHAAEFAANLGGVSVVLGVPIGREDRNSDALLSLLLNSDIADDAVLTWMHQFYEFTTWDDLMGNSARVQEMMNNPLLWRALGGSKKAVGKGVATLAGLSCTSYADIDVVVASSTAMAAVAASQTAMAAVIGNATALNAVVSSSTAMTAIVASPTAMTAIWRSNSAVAAVQKNTTAWKTFTGATSAVMGKTVAILANLNPADYADMTAVAASQTAMTAVAASSTAMTAIANAWSNTESAIVNSSIALNALKNSGKCQNVSKDVKGLAKATFISGLCFVFTAEITVGGGACVIKASRPTGGTELTLCSSVAASTVNKFCKDPYVQCTDSSHTYEKNKLYFYKIG